MEQAKPYIELTDVDRRCYAERLAEFLPAELVDIHAHVWRAVDVPPLPPTDGAARTVTWPSLVARENPIEDLLESYRVLLPGKQVTPLIFGMPPEGGKLEVQNQYVSACAQQEHVPALIFSDPAWNSGELETRIRSGNFLGAKSYLTLAPDYLPAGEIRIFDFFPPHQLAVHDRNGWIVMLHLPRNGRLKDNVNLAQLRQIERDYPNLTLIIAHVGRAYCEEDVGNAFEILADTQRLSFDISANTNEQVFEQLLRCVGPKRVFFGTDLPIARMRMRRITREGRYVNLVPRGRYGDVSGDPNMGEVDGLEAANLTLFLYEELDVFRRAATRAGLSHADIADVFCQNARRVLAKAKGG